MWVSIIILFSIIGCYLSGIVKPSSLLNIILLICAIIPLATNIYGNYEYFPMNYIIISKLILEPTHINFEDRKLEINSIKKIELNVNDWCGKKIIENYRPYGSGPKLSRGVNNELKIYLKESNKVEIRFQLESKQQFRELASWIRNLYQYKIEILEKYDHIRSYGLEHLNYAEIQEFKNRYAT